MGLLGNCIDIFRAYDPKGIRSILLGVALIYLFITEKDKYRRFFLVYTPLLLLFVYFNPVFRKIYLIVVDEVTYYRVLWLVPSSIVIGYAACQICYRYRYVGLVVSIALIILAGDYIYDSVYMTPAENAYHLPEKVVDLCDVILEREGDNVIYATFPSDLVYFVRQYDTQIGLAYGRDSVEPVWDYRHDLYKILNAETVDVEALLEVSRDNSGRVSSYIILPEDKPLSEPMENYDLECVATMHGYQVYYDPVGAAKLKEYYGN